MNGAAVNNETFVHWARLQPQIWAVYLFGSALTGDTTSLSDIDIGVLVNPQCDQGELWRLEAQWAAHWPDQVDLRFLNHAPLPFQYEVTAHGQRLWAADVNQVAAWESLVWRRYWDLQPRLEQDWRLFVQSVMEHQDETQREQYQAALKKVRSVHQRVREAAENHA